MIAKKSYGQHFLKHESIAARIADSLLQAEKYGQVLEVGPGTGMLTQFLLKNQHYQTWAVEADRDMVTALHLKFADFSNRLIFNDFLRFRPENIFADQQFSLVGNFPYNISTQILFKLLDYRHQIPEMVGMFQKEVADRVVSLPGSKIYGITSVLCQAFYRVEYLFTVERGSFQPPPKVESAVIRLTRKEDAYGRPIDMGCHEKLFRQIVKLAFNQRRKMLRNTLKPFFTQEILMSEPFFEKRPEMLSWEEFVALANRAENLKLNNI